ncbi:MAG: hypothetical protein H7328_09980 [Bdellovibrio sp.]|nr:hypothetical protein [Bdellovibrio sp.]
MSNKIILLFAAPFLILASNAFSATPEASQIAKVLNERTNGNDALYNKLLAPDLSLDTSKNKSDRTQAVNKQIASEIDLIIAAFKGAKEADKSTAVMQALNTIEPNVVKSGGAYVTFTDGNPSAATSRSVLLIPKKNSSVTVSAVTNILTSYKRSAKTSDYVYEYETAQNLTLGAIKTRVGTDTSHLPPEAAAPFSLAKNYVLKKCRQLLGWRCVTSFYRADAMAKSTDAFQLVFVAIVDLNSNPDNAEFGGDKRITNQIAGSTAIYIIKESADWILLYGSDFQWNNDKLSFTGVIQKEFQKDAARFRDRISSDLKLSGNDIKHN